MSITILIIKMIVVGLIMKDFLILKYVLREETKKKVISIILDL